jgi:hypothetical protein
MTSGARYKGVPQRVYVLSGTILAVANESKNGCETKNQIITSKKNYCMNLSVTKRTKAQVNNDGVSIRIN